MSIFYLIYFLTLLVVSLAEIAQDPQQLTRISNDQFHSQDSFGQYKYGYVNGESSKEESRSLDGVTRGSYSYLDADGVLQKVFYQADAEHGFMVSGTNIPSAPLTADSSDVITPAFSTKLLAAARKISTGDDSGESGHNRNNLNSLVKTKDDTKNVNDKEKDTNEDKNVHVEKNSGADDKQTVPYPIVFPFTHPISNNNEASSSPNAEYLMPLLTNFDLYIPPNQMPSSQGFEYRDRVTFLPIYQPDYIPPFARSYYRSPFAFLNGFIPLFRTERAGLVSRIPKFDKFDQIPNNGIVESPNH